jgi:plasmid stability protein
MSKMVQIRNMPEKMHRTLKARAALAGMSLSEYLVRELRKSADRPTPEELMERMRRRQRFDIDSAEVLGRGRDERSTHLADALKDVRR